MFIGLYSVFSAPISFKIKSNINQINKPLSKYLSILAEGLENGHYDFEHKSAS